MANNTEQEYELRGKLAFIIGEQANGVRGDAILQLIEAESTRREQALLGSLPEGLYSAHRYNTDDEMKIHLWDTNGTSYDIAVKRPAAEAGDVS